MYLHSPQDAAGRLVKSAGSDSSSTGALDAPFRSIEHAISYNSQLQGPRTICLRSKGVHYLSKPVYITEYKSSALSPLSIEAYSKDIDTGLGRPVISGGVRVGPFNQNGGVWSAAIPENMTRPTVMFNEDGSWLQRARIPKRGSDDSYSRFMGDSSTLKYSAPLRPPIGVLGSSWPDVDRWGFQFNTSISGALPQKIYNAAEVQVLHFHSWTAFCMRYGVLILREINGPFLTRSDLASINFKNHSLLFAQASSQAIGQWAKQGGQRFLLENVKEGLDEPGEWYFDAAEKQVFLIPPEGWKASAASTDGLYATAGQLPVLLYVENGASQFAMKDVELRHADSGVVVNTYYSQNAVVRLQNASHVRFERVLLASSGGCGIVAISDVKNISILDCGVMSVGGDGIAFERSDGIRDVLINNTLVTDTARLILGQPGGIRLKGEQNIVATYNTVSHCPYAGIMIGWQTGTARMEQEDPIFTVGFNQVHDYGLGVLSDFGGIYLSTNDNLCSQKSPQTCFLPALIHDNVIHSCSRYNYGCQGIYMDEQVSGVTMVNNTIFDTKDEGVYFHCGTDNKFENNIIALAGSGSTQLPKKLHPGFCNAGGNPTWPNLVHGFTFQKNIVFVDNSTSHDQPTRKDDIRNVSFVNNLYYAVAAESFTDLSEGPVWPGGSNWKAWRGQGQDIGSVLADPLFQDWQRRDFQLKAGSPALGIGFVPFSSNAAGCSGNPFQ